MPDKLAISCMIVGKNEGHLLQQCLESVSFCDELFYTDLGSSDNSLEIARSFGASIQYHKKVPSCEMVQASVVHKLKNDWVIFIDPDEQVDPSLAEEIRTRFDQLKYSEFVGAVIVPWLFYFNKKRLKGTVWGGINQKYFLVHRDRFQFQPVVHYGRKLLPGYERITIQFDNKSRALHHYWMNSYRVFFKKHIRYLRNEAADRYRLGQRQSIRLALFVPFIEFKKSFLNKKGYSDGFTGFFLSVFWAVYETWVAFGLVRLKYRK